MNPVHVLEVGTGSAVPVAAVGAVPVQRLGSFNLGVPLFGLQVLRCLIQRASWSTSPVRIAPLGNRDSGHDEVMISGNGSRAVASQRSVR
jgi:hypothetical protein